MFRAFGITQCTSRILLQPTRNLSDTSKLIVFDKDGTLLSFDKPWLAWCQRLKAGLAEASALAVERDISKILKDMGVDLNSGKIGLGTFAECSQREVRKELTEGFDATLQRISEDTDLKNNIIDACRREGDGKFPLTDVRGLFEGLKERDYSIVLATADCEQGVDMFMDDNSIREQVDFVMCASNYEEFPPKPNKLSAEKLCAQFDVESKNVVMVGDTPTDMQFGVNGGYGLVVGVTTGVGSAEDLDSAGAHVVLGDLSELIQVLEEFDVENA